MLSSIELLLAGKQIMHLLLATGNADLRISIELMLGEEPGVSIVGAASEVEGLLALIRSSDPDIVILDWDLPGRSRTEFLAEAHRINSQLRFIVLGAEPELKVQIVEAGASACVIKGSPPDELIADYRRTAVQIRSATEAPLVEKE